MIKRPSRPVWAEVNLNNLKFNLRQVKKIVDKNTEIMAVVKADAYGHGMIPVAKTLVEAGIDRLAVALPGEGKKLKEVGINVPIQVLGEVLPPQIPALYQYNLIPTVSKKSTADNLNKIAAKKNDSHNIYIKVDTGMGRIGKQPHTALEFINYVNRLKNLNLIGLMTHFAKADEKTKEYTYHQWELFTQVLNKIRKKGIKLPEVQVANSATIIDLSKMNMDVVRPGIMLYGLPPSKNLNNKVELKPVLNWKAKIVYLKKVPPDSGISYGATYITDKTTEVATIPLGYADGYSRLLSNKAEVLIGGERAPVIGRVCMDQFMVDVTDIHDVKEGDEVILIGDQGKASITATELAELMGTINYEVLCGISKRITRVYAQD